MKILFDIGGTKTRVALSSDGASFGTPIKLDTPQEYTTGVDALIRAATELLAGATPTSAAGGIAGPLSEDKGTLVSAPNLPQWIGKPIRDDLARALGVPVTLENDASVVGLGEAHFGAGRGFPIVAYLTVSTGVGGTRIEGGKVSASAFGFEPGHQVLDIDKTVFPMLSADEAEELVSGTATAERFGKKAYEVADPEAWEELARLLGYVLNNVAVFWSPHVIVLGGSMIVGDPAISVERATEWFDKICQVFPKKPLVRKAELSDVGGLYGALVLGTRV